MDFPSSNEFLKSYLIVEAEITCTVCLTYVEKIPDTKHLINEEGKGTQIKAVSILHLNR